MSRVREHIGHGPIRDRLALEARRAARPLVIYGATALVAVLALSYVLRSINAVWPWTARETFKVAVPDATGIVAGDNEVRISGMRVGKVTDAALTGGRAVLTLSIDPRYGAIYRDARIAVRPQTPLADQYVDIVRRGDASAGKVGTGDVLPATRASGSVDLPTVLDTFDANVRAHLKTLIDSFGYGLRDNGDQLRSALAALTPFLVDAQRLTAEVAKRRRIAAGLVHNLALLMAELGRRDHELTALVREASGTASALATTRGSLGRIISELPPALEHMSLTFARLRSTLATVDPTLRALRPTATALAPGLRALRAIAHSARPAFDALGPAVRALDPLATSLRPATDDLAAGFTRLAPQAPRLDRITAKVSRCELAVQKFFQWTPSVFKFGDAYGAYPRGESTFGSNTPGGTTRDPHLSQGPSCTGATG